MQSSADFQSEIAKLRHDVEEYAKQFPTIGFDKETMKYKNWEERKPCCKVLPQSIIRFAGDTILWVLVSIEISQRKIV